MNEVKVYTQTYCPYCDRAKSLLKEKGVNFEEINLDGKPDELNSLREKTGMRTVPQIFIGEELIGGYSELSSLDQEGKLDTLLGLS